MRTSEKFQMLTTGRIDQNGNQIPPDIIEWDLYDSNPVLLYDKTYEGHAGVVVGQVVERKRIGQGWAGKLSFMERFADADIAYEKYSQGVLPHVSIGGFAVGEEKDGVFIAMRYRVREFSLVKFPANVDAKVIDAAHLSDSEKELVGSLNVEGKEVRYVTMSAKITDEDMVILNADTMSKKTNDDGHLVDDKGRLINEDGHLVNANAQLINENGHLVNAEGKLINEDGHLVNEDGHLVNEDGKLVNADNHLVNEEGKLVNADNHLVNEDGRLVNADNHLVNEDGRLVNADNHLVNEDGKLVNADNHLVNEDGKLVNADNHLVNEDGKLVNADNHLVNEDGKLVNADNHLVNEEGKLVNADNHLVNEDGKLVNADNHLVNDKGELVNAEGLVLDSSGNPLPKNMTWHQRNANNNNKKQFEMKTFKELNCDADFQKRMKQLSAAIGSGASKTDATPENAETIQVLAEAMLQDENVVILASRTNYTNAITQKKSNALEVLIEAAAGNATDATLAAADLGVITYLSLFYEKLLANDTFRRSIRLVPMSDKAGAIYIEDAVAAPTYVGINTPINAPNYTYEDIKRTVARRVFAFNPILFQHSELAILNYDKQSKGLQSTMAQLMQDISTYWLQIVANTSGIGVHKTTGGSYASAGEFPIEAPNSNLTILKPTLEDVIAIEGKFLMQNFNFGESGKYVEMVLPANTYSKLAGDPEVRNQLTRELNANIASMINFSASKITPRNPVARWENTGSQFELDPALYADKNVANDGTFTDIVPATTTANHLGAGLAFVKDEVLAGVGTIELIASPSPNNYGTVISGWVSTGCTVAREGGKGVVGVVPGV